MSLTKPLDADPLASSGGKTAGAIVRDIVDAIDARTSETIFTTEAFPDIPAVVLHAADVVSGSGGTWTVPSGSGFGGAVAVLDTVNKTTGTGSVSGDLLYLSGSGNAGTMYCNLSPAVSVGSHTDFDMDVRWTLGSGSGSNLGFEVVVASGAGLTGTIVSKTIGSTVPTEDIWSTVQLHLAGTALTSIASFGIRKRSTSSGATGKHVIFKCDNAVLSATSGIDQALATAPAAIIIPPDFSSGFGQGLLTLGTTQSLLDFRPSNTNLSRFRGVKSLRDWMLDETGTTDVTAAFSSIVSSLQAGDILTAPPTAKYRIDGHVFITNSFITIDMQGARFIAPNITGEAIFSLQGDYVTLRNWRIFSNGLPLTTTLGSSMTAVVAGGSTVSGTNRLLNNIGDEWRIPLRASNLPEADMTERYARDSDGYIQFDISASQATPVSGDCTVSVTPHVPDFDGFGNPIFDYQTTLPLTPVQTTYTVKFRPPDPFARTRLTISKTKAGSPITIYNILAYRKFAYNTATVPVGGDATLNAAVLVNGSGCVIEDFWAEGNGGDALQIRGNDMHGLRVRKFFARGQGREGIEVSQGSDILIEDFVLAGCAREPVDIEPETDLSAISNLRWRNGIMGTGRNIGFTCSGANRANHITLEDIWVRNDTPGTGNVWFSDLGPNGAVRNLVYTSETTGAAKQMVFGGDGADLDNIVSDGPVLIQGTNHRIGDIFVRNVTQTGSFIMTGSGHQIKGDIVIGDPTLPVTIDTGLAVNPVQLTADTIITGSIKTPFLNQQLGGTYRSSVLTGRPYWPRGLDILGSGIRQLRGLSATATPANNLRGIGLPAALNSTSLDVVFPPKTDHRNPSSFAIAVTGPHTQLLTADHQVKENSGNWQVKYNGVTSGKTITGAVYTSGTPWQSGDPGQASSNPFPRGTVTFTTSPAHDVLVGDDVGVVGTVSTGASTGTGADSKRSFDNEEFQGDAIVKPRTYVVTAVSDSTHFTVAYKNGIYSSDPGTWVSGGTLGLGPDAKAAIVQRWLRALSTVFDTDVTVSGSGSLTTTGLILTWAQSLGDIPETMFDTVSEILSWKGFAQKLTVLTTTQIFGGFLVANQWYVYRAASTTLEGEPLVGLAAKKIQLTSGNAVSLTFSGLYDLTTDLKVTGTTVWRAGPFSSDPVLPLAVPYTRRVDLPGVREFSFPTGGTDRETSFSGIPWVTGSWTSAEIDQNQSGWEPDNNFAMTVTPNFDAGRVWVTKDDTAKYQHHGAGATIHWTTAAPAGAEWDYHIDR